MGVVKLIIADDHAVFRAGVRQVLESRGYEVVAEAGDGLEAMEQAVTHPGCILLLDIGMPGKIDGLEVTRKLTEREVDVRIIILSAREDQDALLTAMSAGAKGYLAKDADMDQVVSAIELVVKGGTAVGGSAVGSLSSGIDGLEYSPGEYARRRSTLSARELQILSLLATPSSPAQIASHLFLSKKTVENHISAIYRKLGVRSRPEAVVKAMELHLISSAG
jgi:DNA-binding NarL/FixJ family response regulator